MLELLPIAGECFDGIVEFRKTVSMAIEFRKTVASYLAMLLQNSKI